MIRLNTLRSKARTTIRKLPKIRPHGRNYVPVGLELGKRVFQTMQVLTAAGNPTDEEFHYQYDSAGRILQSAFAQTKQSTVTSVGPNGSFYEPQARSRARAVHNYNEFGELESLNYYWDCPELTTTPSQLIASNVNAYDHLGRRTSTAYNYGSPWTETFAYATNLDYLTSASYSDNSNWNGTWGYDAAQNRSDVTTDILNRITGKVGNANVSYAHNAVGERTLRTNLTPGNQFGQVNGKSHYQWSELGRLRQFKSTINFGQSDQLVSKYDYRYRQDGLRVAKIGGLASTGSVELEEESSSYWDEDLADNSPTWRYSYDGQMPVWEDYYRYEGGHYMVWDVTRSTLGGRGIDMIERQRMSDKENPNPGTASRVFPLYDGHGNTMGELARTGATSYAVGNLRKYDAWGNSRLNSASSGFHGYCGNLGHKEDPESGLTYMRARYYEPGTGRFISQDPAYDGINWYGYCAGNPVDRVDSTGKYWFVAILGVALIGAVFGMLSYAAYQGGKGEATTPGGYAGAAFAGAALALIGLWVAAAVAAGAGTALTAAWVGEQILIGAVGAQFGVGVAGIAGHIDASVTKMFTKPKKSGVESAVASIYGQQLIILAYMMDM